MNFLSLTQFKELGGDENLDDGVLYIHKNGYLFALTTWPVVTAFVLDSNGNWTQYDPDEWFKLLPCRENIDKRASPNQCFEARVEFRVPIFLDLVKKIQPDFIEWQSAIPNEIYTVIFELPHGQWRALKAASELRKPIYKLLRKDPRALYVLLHFHEISNMYEPEICLELLNDLNSESNIKLIFDLLLLSVTPFTDNTIEILHKIPLEHFHVKTIKHLILCLSHQENTELFLLLDRIGTSVINICLIRSTTPTGISNSAINTTLKYEDSGLLWLEPIMRDIERIRSNFKLANIEINSLCDSINKHEELISGDYREKIYHSSQGIPNSELISLPSFDYSIPYWLQPIRFAHELIVEESKMHRGGTFSNPTEYPNLYFFILREPQRATLILEKREVEFNILILKIKGHESCNSESFLRVKKWLISVNQKIRGSGLNESI